MELTITMNTDLARRLDEQGFAGPLPVLSQEERRGFLRAIPAEPPPLDWNKGLACTSRRIYDVATHPVILKVVSSVLGKHVLLWGAGVVQRSPGAVHPWHTDIETSSPTARSVTVWLGLQHTSRGSAPRFMSHSQRFGRTVQETAWRHGRHRRDMTSEDVERWARALDERSRLESLDISDGEAVFFDGRAWHGTENETADRRVALLFQYATPETPIRIPDLTQLEWPFRFVTVPRPPCLLVRGDDQSGVNRIVAAPASSRPNTPPRMTSRIHALDCPLPQESESGWTPHHLFRGSTAGLRMMNCHASVLDPGRCPHPPHTHLEEEILMVLAGEVDVILPALREPEGGERRRLRRGEFVYYPAHFPHTLEATSQEPAHYLMFKWLGEPPADGLPISFGQYTVGQEPPTAAAPRAVNHSLLFQGATNWLRKLQSHATWMRPGAGYDAHADSHDVAIVVLEGEVETLGERVGPNGVIFYAAGEPHGMRNPGLVPASYLVFEFHGSHNGLGSSLSAGIEVATPGQRRQSEFAHSPYDRLRELVRLTLPPRAKVLVISKGDDRLLDLDGREGLHFPQGEDGIYCGYHPTDSEEAISRLTTARARGAEFLLVPATSFWWFDYYVGFKQYLTEHCPIVTFADRVGVIFKLQSPTFRVTLR